ncbi:hypothetical protein AVEN_182490-1, partial [Araneus ventricosus]
MGGNKPLPPPPPPEFKLACDYLMLWFLSASHSKDREGRGCRRWMVYSFVTFWGENNYVGDFLDDLLGHCSEEKVKYSV